MKLSVIKDVFLVVSILIIVFLIIFKKENDPIIIHDNIKSIEMIKELDRKIDSIDNSVLLINTHKENEKIIIDSITGVHAHDSLLSKYYGFTSKK